MCRPRLPRKTAIVLALLVTALAVPRAGQAAASTVGPAAGQHAFATRTVTEVAHDSTAIATTQTSGLCSVPGVGDIGGLFGFCSLGSSGLTGDLNNICQPSLPNPEPADSGIDAMIAPPETGKQPATLYDQYGVAGDYWAATNLQCSDMTSLIGNNVAGMVFDVAKSIDRVTITVYQSAAGEGILGWLQKATDKLITSLGNAIYFPYLAVVVILGAIWLAWQGLIRKRGTRTIEGTIWMVVACAAAILLIGRPADVTGLGRGVSDGMSQALNAAFAKLPSPGPTSCVPLQKGDPQAPPASYSYTSGGTVVDQNADELWTVLVCKPWLDGEFGSSVYSTGGGRPTAVNVYGRSLLWSQAIATDEKPTQPLISAKQAAYAGIASSIQHNDPASYPLFQGKQWTSRLEIAFAALFAAVVAGVLVLLIAVTLILLKLGFLLLLIVGPFFLLVGTHPGFGRVIALRWVELLVGVLLKQAAVAVVLSVLLYCYALIMGTSDAVLPWALKILMIALVTVAAFIYRRPFQHLFSAVGYGVIGSHDQAEAGLQRAGASARANSLRAATLALPPFAAYRAGRWARRNPAQAAGLALGASSGGAAAVAAGVTAADAVGQPAPSTAEGSVATPGVGADGAAGRAVLAARTRAWPNSHGSAVAEAPPLKLPARDDGKTGSSTRGTSPPASSTASPSTAGIGAGIAAGQARGTWPAGRMSSSAPAAAPPRLVGSGSSPAAGQPAGSSAPVQRPARSSGRRAGPLQRRAEVPVRRQNAADRRRDSPPVRQRVRGQASASPRPQPPERRAPSESRSPGGAEAPPLWQGQRLAGPLASRERDPVQDQAGPFWLRPQRRK